MSRRDDLRPAVRQWRFPRRWRIAPRDVPPGVVDLIAVLRATAEATARDEGPGTTGAVFDDRVLAEAATGLFRARQRMRREQSRDPDGRLRLPLKFVQDVWRAFEEAEVTIQDHTGKPFDSGLPLRVVAFDEVPGTAFEQIAETLRPTVYVRDRMIQMGEVVVATPPGDAGADDAQPAQPAQPVVPAEPAEPVDPVADGGPTPEGA